MNLKCFAAVTAVPLLGMTLHAAEIEITPGTGRKYARHSGGRQRACDQGEADARDFPLLCRFPPHIAS